MLKRIALCFMFAFAFTLTTGCAHFQNVTPEQAIVRAIAANKVVAQCYADYIREVDALSAEVILHDNGLKPESEYIADVPLASAVAK